jgi:hypothetical protein
MSNLDTLVTLDLINNASFHWNIFACLFLEQNCWKLVSGDGINWIIYSVEWFWITETPILQEKQKAAKDWSIFPSKQNVWI